MLNLGYEDPATLIIENTPQGDKLTLTRYLQKSVSLKVFMYNVYLLLYTAMCSSNTIKLRNSAYTAILQDKKIN